MCDRWKALEIIFNLGHSRTFLLNSVRSKKDRTQASDNTGAWSLETGQWLVTVSRRKILLDLFQGVFIVSMLPMATDTSTLNRESIPCRYQWGRDFRNWEQCRRRRVCASSCHKCCRCGICTGARSRSSRECGKDPPSARCSSRSAASASRRRGGDGLSKQIEFLSYLLLLVPYDLPLGANEEWTNPILVYFFLSDSLYI